MRALQFHVIGDPVGHSLSPPMQRAALRHLGLPHRYDALLVTPVELPRTLDRVRRGEIAGLNVTVPHKIAALRLCDIFDDEVAATGAVNTLRVDATGRLVGSNTDVDGFRADLLALSIVPRRVLILGAGGAARAAAIAVRTLRADVEVASRDPASARELVAQVGSGNARAWDALPSAAPFDLIVNATSAGMAGGEGGGAIAEALSAAPRCADAVAYDMVYRAPGGAATPFLQRARALGVRGVDGIGMLVEQGARALSIFLGVPIDAQVHAAMRSAVVDALLATPLG